MVYSLDQCVESCYALGSMREMKNTPRSTVHIGFDGRVHKRFSGKCAQERFENEVRILEYLEERGC